MGQLLRFLKPTTVYLSSKQRMRLRRLSLLSKATEASLIRLAVERFLSEYDTPEADPENLFELADALDRKIKYMRGGE